MVYIHYVEHKDAPYSDKEAPVCILNKGYPCPPISQSLRFTNTSYKSLRPSTVASVKPAT